GQILEPQRKRDVLEHREVRVERVVLKHHREVALVRRRLVHALAVDAKLAGRDRLETDDHPQQRRLPAARRADEDHQLAVLDVERDVVDSDEAVAVALHEMLELDAGHGSRLLWLGPEIGVRHPFSIDAVEDGTAFARKRVSDTIFGVDRERCLTRFSPPVRRHAHPFTAPAVSPATILRWNSRTRTITGMVTTSDAAAICAAGCSKKDSPVKNASAAGTGLAASDAVSEMPNTKSFHAKKNVKIAAVKTPGAASGTITSRNACHGVAPSTCAACSISHGISRKNADSVQIDSGSVNDMYGMMSPIHVS